MVTVLEVAFSVGMLISGVLVSTILAKRSRIGLILVSTLGFGLLVPLFFSPFTTLIQETVEPEMQGRAFGYVGIVTIAVMIVAMSLPSGRAAMAAGRAADPERNSDEESVEVS